MKALDSLENIYTLLLRTKESEYLTFKQKIQFYKSFVAHIFGSLSLKKAGDQPKRWNF